MKSIFERPNREGLNKNIKILLNRFVGPALFVWLSYSVYRQLKQQPDLSAHLQEIRLALLGKDAWMLVLVCLLMLVNWGLETWKWQLLLRPLHAFKFPEAFRAVFSGVAFSLNTPNRIGEYGGRVLFVPEGKRWRAVSLTVAASFSQLLITLFMGGMGLVLLRRPLLSAAETNTYPWIYSTVLVGSGCLAFIGLLMYFRLGNLVQWIGNRRSFHRIVRHLRVLREIDRLTLWQALLLSLIRFVVFALQYWLMLRLMQVEIGWSEGFWAISVFFLGMAIVPTIALLELGLRWQFGLLLFGLFTPNLVGVYAAATGIWLINLVLPAAVGSLFVFGIRVFSPEK